MNTNDDKGWLGNYEPASFARDDAVVQAVGAGAARGRRIRRISAGVAGGLGVLLLATLGATTLGGLSTLSGANSLDPAQAGGKFQTEAPEDDKDESTADDKEGDVVVSPSEKPTEEPTQEPKKKDSDTKGSGGGTDETDKDGGDKRDEPKDEPKCDAEEREYKYKNESTGCEWVLKDGWYWDGYSDSFEKCTDGKGPAHEFGYYSCAKGKWVPATGWVLLYDYFAPCQQWVDAATDTTFWGGLVEFDGWKKMVPCSPGEGTYGESYRVIYKKGDTFATIGGGTCTGITETIKGAPHQWSCNPKKWGANGTEEWILKDSAYKWFPLKKRYFHKDATVEWEGSLYEWSGSEWVDVTPEPDPEPSPSTGGDAA